MARRLGAGLLLALGLATPALADTLWFKPEEGAANREAIERGWLQADGKRVRFFEGPRFPGGPTALYLRGRIIGLEKDGAGKTTQIRFEAWSRPEGARAGDPIPPECVSNPFLLPVSYIAAIDHEVDSLLDLQLMFSDRHNLSRAQKPVWEKMFGPSLSPLLENPAGGVVGHIDLNLDGQRPAPENPSPPAGVEHPGWVLKHLVDRPPTARAAASETRDGAYTSPSLPGDTFSSPKQARSRLEGATPPPGLDPNLGDPFHPIHLDVGIQRATHELLLGLARLAYYTPHDRQTALGANGEPPLELSHAEFERCLREAIRFLCRLAMVQGPEQFDANGAPRPLSGTDLFKRRYHDAGMAAREAVIQVLEAAAPGMLAPEDFANQALRDRIQDQINAFNAYRQGELSEEADRFTMRYDLLLSTDPASLPPPRIDPAADLAVSPSALAQVALTILVDAPEWWVVHSRLEQSPGNPNVDTIPPDPRAPKRYRRDPAAELPDIDRLTSAVLDLANPGKDRESGLEYPDPRRDDAARSRSQFGAPGSAWSEVHDNLAPLMLVRILRPRVPHPRASGDDPGRNLPADASQRRALEQRLDESAHVFAEELAHSLTEGDSGRREAAREALRTAVRLPGDPILTKRMIEDLLDAASAQNQREEVTRETQRETLEPGSPPTQLPPQYSPVDEERRRARQHTAARRKHAIRVLMILAQLKNSPNKREEAVGRMVLQRLVDIQEAAAEGRANQGELNMLRTFRELKSNPQVSLAVEATELNEGVRAQLDERRREISERLEQLRRELSQEITDSNRRRALEREQRDCEERRERLRRLREK